MPPGSRAHVENIRFGVAGHRGFRGISHAKARVSVVAIIIGTPLLQDPAPTNGSTELQVNRFWWNYIPCFHGNLLLDYVGIVRPRDCIVHRAIPD